MIRVLGNVVEDNQSKDIEETDEECKKLRYKKLSRHYLANEIQKQQKEKVTLTAAAYHQGTCILIAGFSNGSFYLYEMPDVNTIHSLRYHSVTPQLLILNGNRIFFP